MVQLKLTAAIAALLIASHASAATIDLTTTTGWASHFLGTAWSNGTNQYNFLTLGKTAGRNSSTYFRTYLAFNLAEIKGQVIAAELLMRNGAVNSQDATETVVLHDFSASIVELQINFPQWRFDDLNTGVVYGMNSEFSSSATPETTRSFPLNASAISAINSASGSYFMMGASISSLTQALTSEHITHTADTRDVTLRLTVVPEPAATLLTLPALMGFMSLRRKAVHKSPVDATE